LEGSFLSPSLAGKDSFLFPSLDGRGQGRGKPERVKLFTAICPMFAVKKIVVNIASKN